MARRESPVKARRGRVVAVMCATCLVAALFIPAASFGAQHGKLVVTVKVIGGGNASGLLVCAQKSRKSGGAIQPDGERCAAVSKGKARLQPKAGEYFIRVYGGVGGGPCYSQEGDGLDESDCSRAKVKAGQKTKVTWHMPSFG